MPAASHQATFDALFPLVLLALAAWGAVAAAVGRDRARGLHAALAASIALSLVGWDGSALGSPWPSAGSWSRSALVAIDATVALLAALFARELLRTSRNAPGVDPLLRAMAVLSALAVPLAAPATWALGLELVGLVSLLGPPILFAAGVLAWRAGSRPARPYLAAHGCLLAGMLVEVAGDPARGAAHGTEAGAVAMALALAYGLSVRDRARGPSADAGIEARGLREAAEEALRATKRDGVARVGGADSGP